MNARGEGLYRVVAAEAQVRQVVIGRERLLAAALLIRQGGQFVCYAYVMAIRRITLSVPADVAGRIKKAAGDKAVSAWVTDLIEEHLEDANLQQQWDDFCRDVKVTRQDEQKANALFKRLTRRSSRRGAA